MSVDIKTVEKIAELAKLSFDESGKEKMQKDMNKMLDFVSQLQEVDTEGVEPLIYMLDEKAILREDVVQQDISQQEALKNAPLKDSDFIKVPTVLKR